MKKIFVAFMALATLALVGCNKKTEPNPNPQPIVPDTGTVKVPELDEPEAGTIRFIIQIPKNSECNGVALKGTYDGENWSGANTYLGPNMDAKTPAAECITFEPVKDWENWYTADYAVAEEGFWDAGLFLAGKICLIYTDDGNWDGQAVDWEFLEDNCTATVSTSDDGNLQVGSRKGLVYVTVGGWNKSECVEVVEHDYVVTFKLPEFCEDFEIEAIGDFDSWAGTEFDEIVGNEATIEVHAAEGDKIKVRQAGTWDNQIQLYDEEGAEWKDASDNILGAETNVVIDYTSGRWTVCAEDEGGEAE